MAKMRKSNQILQNFFGKINDNYILNVLYVLRLILNIEKHQKRLEKILNISNPRIALDEFSTAVKYEIHYFESNLKEDPDYLMQEIVTGKKINVIKDTPVIWCFIALYWSYNLKNKDQTLITEIYNPKIGDIALKFLLFFLQMKQKEAHMVCVEHKSSFYEDLSARLVRVIDILPVMDVQASKHLKELYFPNSQAGLALNFLKVQVENPWEGTTLSVKIDSKTGKNAIQYKHDNENLNFIIQPSRMTKDGAFRDLDKTYNQLTQLYNLDLASSKTKYSFGNKRKSSKKKILPVIEPLGEELIYEDSSTDPEILGSEDQIEQKAKRKAYRRDMNDFSDTDEDSEEEAKEYVIPNAFQQHKRNVAFSSKLSKERLLLKSDYDIPVTEHLKAFISTLNTEDNDSKIYTGYFILNVSLVCKNQDLMSLLQEREEGSFQLKNRVIIVDIDNALFANNYSKLLSQSEDKLAFNIPITMVMLIVMMKKTILAKDFNKGIFLEKYKEFIKTSIKAFPKSITIKIKQLHRYSAQYMRENGKDILTGKLATAVYSQNDTAGLAYTSSRSNAAEHSSFIQEYWDELGLSGTVSNILDINTNFSTNVSSIASEKFSGTSQVVETNTADVFFKVLQQNIYDQNNSEDLHFNLVTIYIRYAMSLLSGTRPFYESANFTSYNDETGMWMISEKAQDIASGTRLVPLCNIMNALLNDYQKILEEKGLKNNFYLIMDAKPVIFSSYKAHKFLQNTHNLDDRETLEEYVKDVPLNSGRHLFTREAIENKLDTYYISTYLGHYSASEEQFGIYSTLNVQDYCNSVKNITTKIAHVCGIKEL